MIVFARESFTEIRNEICPLWEAHFSEVCRDQDAVPLDVDEATYTAMEVREELVVITARRLGDLVGYAFIIVGKHIHHRSTTVAQTDMYYLRPDCRGGRTALRFFRAVEREAASAGAVRFVIETLAGRNHTRLLRHLGYEPNEIMMHKLLGAT